MLDLREGIQSINSDNPKSLYFFTGEEYGVKVEYLDILKKHYNQCLEVESLDELLKSFKVKSLIPRIPSLYVVRYDKQFIKDLNKDKVKEINKLNILGTIVGIYQDNNDEEKLDKYFEKNVLRVNKLSSVVMIKHLKSSYPSVPDNLLKVISENSVDYYQAKLRCESLVHLNSNEISQNEIIKLFGQKFSFDFQRFKLSVCSRNYKYALKELDNYESDYYLLLYEILQVMLDIAKGLENKYNADYTKEYLNLWDKKSVKLMYHLVFDQINMLRNNSTYKEYDSLVYSLSMLNFRLS